MEIKTDLHLRVNAHLRKHFELCCKKLGLKPEHSKFYEHYMKKVIAENSSKFSSLIYCECGANFSSAAWDKHPLKYTKGLCISCGLKIPSQLFSNEERSEDATRPAREHKSVVQSLG